LGGLGYPGRGTPGRQQHYARIDGKESSREGIVTGLVWGRGRETGKYNDCEEWSCCMRIRRVKSSTSKWVRFRELGQLQSDHVLEAHMHRVRAICDAITFKIDFLMGLA
jgi:hypothetical protein